ncbi:MAG: hypothetical protein RL885_20755 [Planctomycetota bacterium]
MARTGLFAGVFLVALGVLLFQVALTRVFSLMMWFHLAYLVVSLALLGFGAAGSFLTRFGEAEREDDPYPRLALFASGFGVTLILAFLSVTLLRLDALAVRIDAAPFVALLISFLALSAPFFFGGLAIGSALTRFRAQVGRVYFVDLLGSAAGGLLSVLALAAFGPTKTIVLAGCAGLLAGACFSWHTRFRTALLHHVLLASGLILATGFFGGGFGIPAIDWRIPYAPDKEVKVGAIEGRPAAILESATAQVEIGHEQHQPNTMFGEFGRLGQEEIWVRLVTQDGTAPTALYADAGDVARFDFLDHAQQMSGYTALAAQPHALERVLVIGVGGGVDVMMALRQGAESVRGVEINRAMVRAVSEDFKSYIGALFDDPRVELINAEGRAYLRRDDSRYDLIQLTGVDTYSALASGAYTLSESYLYTLEAIRDFYRHLQDDGLINCSRFFQGVPRTPRETIRYANLVREALAREGVREPWRQIVVFQGYHWASTLVKRGPFTEAECQALRELARAEGFMGMIHDPCLPTGAPGSEGFGWARLRLEEAAGVIPKLRELRPRAIAALEDGLVVRELEQALAEAANGRSAAAAERRHGLIERADPSVRDEVSEGIEAWWVEATDRIARSRAKLGQVQRDFETMLRSSDEARERFIEDYPFDLRTPTDDAPFFFNYFRLSKLGAAREEEAAGNYLYLPNIPVGHLVLFGSLAQVTLLGAIFILWPLRRLRAAGAHRALRLRTFGYFSALGIGYMFIEIAAMQKLVLFLGHPTHSLSIVLPTLLAATGLGALASSRVREPSPGIFARLLLAIVLAVGFLVAGVTFGLEPLLGLPFLLRAGVTALLLAPIGFLLGFPFPLGLRRLDAVAPGLVPWAWAINGFLSVFSATFATVLAMSFGFTVVLGLAALVYALGLPCLAKSRAEPE